MKIINLIDAEDLKENEREKQLATNVEEIIQINEKFGIERAIACVTITNPQGSTEK